MARTSDPFCARIYGRSEPPAGNHSRRAVPCWRASLAAGLHTCVSGSVDLFLRPWEVDISRRTSLDSPLPVQVLEASPKGHYTQLVVQPLGWYNEPLTVVMHGDDAPQRGERLFVGLQHARLYNGDERIETRDEELALAQSA